MDIYNLLNSAAVLSYNQAFIAGGAWLVPTSVMSARFAKLSLQFEFYDVRYFPAGAACGAGWRSARTLRRATMPLSTVTPFLLIVWKNSSSPAISTSMKDRSVSKPAAVSARLLQVAVAQLAPSRPTTK